MPEWTGRPRTPKRNRRPLPARTGNGAEPPSGDVPADHPPGPLRGPPRHRPGPAPLAPRHGVSAASGKPAARHGPRRPRGSAPPLPPEASTARRAGERAGTGRSPPGSAAPWNAPQRPRRRRGRTGCRKRCSRRPDPAVGTPPEVARREAAARPGAFAPVRCGCQGGVMSDFSAFVAAVRAGDPDECNATVRAAFRETAELPAEEIAARTAELAELIGSDPVPVDCAAYPALVGGALVESGHGAGPAGPAALRRLAGAAPDLRSFLRALPGPDGAGGAPEPGRVDDGQAARITRELGDGGAAVRTWRALDLLGRAVLTFLNVEEVRDGLRADPEVSAVLRALCTELDEAVGGYRPALLLLDLNEVDTLLVLDRESGRGFRIRPT